MATKANEKIETAVDSAVDEITKTTLETTGTETPSEGEGEGEGEPLDVEISKVGTGNTETETPKPTENETPKTNEPIAEDVIISELRGIFKSRNNYSHIVAGRHLKNEINKESILKFGAEFATYGVSESTDGKVLELIEKLKSL